MPPSTRTVARSSAISTTRGRPASEISSPEVSAIRLNECPLPSTRARSAPATRSCSSATEVGRWKPDGEKTTLPAQFVTRSLIPSPYLPGGRPTPFLSIDELRQVSGTSLSGDESADRSVRAREDAGGLAVPV